MNRMDIDHGFQNQFGKGPKNWQRSDSLILEDICHGLTFHSDLDATDIHVYVVNGTVNLEGWVNNRQEKWLAEEVTEQVLGVKSLHNRIHLRNRLIKSD